MSQLLKTLAKVSLNTTDHILFRSISKPFGSNLRMSSTVSIEEMRVKSAQANDMIEKLKKQIESIKSETSAEKMAVRSSNLQKENAELKKKVEELKKTLEAAEAKSILKLVRLKLKYFGILI